MNDENKLPDWLYVGALCKTRGGECVEIEPGYYANFHFIAVTKDGRRIPINDNGRSPYKGERHVSADDLVGPWDGECNAPFCCKLRELAEAVAVAWERSRLGDLDIAINDLRDFLIPPAPEPAPKPELPAAFWPEGLTRYVRSGGGWVADFTDAKRRWVAPEFVPQLYAWGGDRLDRPEGI